MKAAYIDGFCDPAGIKYGDLPDPVPAAGEVLVRVEAVAVNRVDTFVRSGAWRTPVTFPLAVGRDLAGTVLVAGAGAGAGFAAGDRVWTNSAGYGGRGGATAELAVVARDRLYRLPDGADPVRFVAALHPGATAHGSLARAGLSDGETVAIVGANGAVGMCLIQAARSAGATPVAVVRSGRVAGRLRDIGAAAVVVTADAADAAAALPGPVDVFVDTTGRVSAGEVTGALRHRGRVLLIAGAGNRAEFDQWRFYTAELQLIGFIMSGMTVPELAAAATWINERRPEVTVGDELCFADAAQAHLRQERGELPHAADGTVGRLVLRP